MRKFTLKKYLLVFTVFLLGVQLSNAEDCPECFITKWLVEEGENIKIGIDGDYNYTVEDLNQIVQLNDNGSEVLTLSGLAEGEYILKLAPNDENGTPMHRFYLYASNKPDLTPKNLREVIQWGDIQWSSFESMFSSCSEMIVTATDIPNTENVTSMQSTFLRCSKIETIPNINSWNTSHVENMRSTFNAATSFNQPIDNWDVSKVTNMYGLFSGASSFNQPLNNWDVSNVVDMTQMFHEASSFNQPINDWNVGKVENMYRLFWKAPSFNQPLDNWNVSNVKNMIQLFCDASSFDQPIGNWDVSNVEYMELIFSNATSFNQPIGEWDVSKVKRMYRMFENATSFNQPIGNWNVGHVEDMHEMFSGARLFNQPIGDWNVSNVKDMNYMFSYAVSFNQSIGAWEVDNVVNMDGMFQGASSFNQPIGDWDVSSVENMRAMFSNNKAFNQPLENWDVSNVKSMMYMFMLSSFNQPIGDWDVSHVENFEGAFQNAADFNQYIGDWDISSAQRLSYMLNYSGLDCQNYSDLLIGWSNNPNIPENMTLGVQNLEYGIDAINARDILLAIGWEIQGDILDEGCTVPTRIKNKISKLEWNVYPNPTAGNLQIELSSPVDEQMTFTVFGLDGKKMMTEIVPKNQNTIQKDLSNLSKGIYLLQVQTLDGVFSQKVILQ